MIARTACLLLIVFSTPVLAACPYKPDHQFSLTVIECRGVTFVAAGFKDPAGFELDVPESNFSGTVLSGVTHKHSYAWGGNAPYESFEYWPEQSYRSVFIARPAQEFCASVAGVNLRLKVQETCCDTPPFFAQCLVNLPQVEVLRFEASES
jgi:hypothetical protein